MTNAIDELTRRTAMLGLNAAIEAARVGENGHGFGKVATEIGALASKARASTADIARIVTDLEFEVNSTAAVNDEGLAAVAEGIERQRVVTSALRRIADHVEDTTRATRDITAATSQQRTASDAVVSAMRLVTTASQGATAATRTHAASATRLRDLMQALRDTVGRFRVD
jgi:methyl-accepting chemotaxis protein